MTVVVGGVGSAVGSAVVGGIDRIDQKKGKGEKGMMYLSLLKLIGMGEGV